MKLLRVVLWVITPAVLSAYNNEYEANEPVSVDYQHQSLDSYNETWNRRKPSSLTTPYSDNKWYYIIPSKYQTSPGKQLEFPINELGETRTKRVAKSFRGANPNYPWGHFSASGPHSGYPFPEYSKPEIGGTQIGKRPSIPWNPSGTRGNIGVARIGSSE